MTYEELCRSEVTLSENNSRKIVLEVMGLPDWRCYSSQLCPETEQLIDRFLASHAKMPGVISDQMLAVMPIDVFRWTAEIGRHFFGGTFLNGAVVTVTNVNPDISLVKLLFVDDPTTKQWIYPENPEYYRYLGGRSE